jgi:uncharacterized membrane protein YgcG
VLWGLALVAVLLGARARAQGLDWDIDSFHTEIEVMPDASMLVRETIIADFSREPHHGIFREIPLRYRRGGSSFALRLEVLAVADGEGHAREYSSERRDGRLRLKIGSPREKVQGRQVYAIEYRVERGLLTFDSHDELYWNATGTEWPVPIEQAACTVRLPGAADAGSIRAQSYVGAYGSSASGPEPSVEGRTVAFEVARPLREWEGLTVVVGWAPGAVEHPGFAARLGWFLRDNWIVAVPLLTAPLLWLVWRAWGRDQGPSGSIVVRYEAPDGMSPLEVGTLIDERVDTRDVSAALVGLAARGYLRINASDASALGSIKPGEVTLVSLRKADDAVTDAERVLLSKVFSGRRSVKLSDLQHKFYAHMPHIRQMTYDALIRRGCFGRSPAGVRGRWMLGGLLWALGWLLLTMVVVGSEAGAPTPWVIALILGAPQVMVLAPFMPRRTTKGRRLLEQVRGLEEYILRAERRELEERAGQAGFQPHFESILPYAMALGLVEEWGEKFEGLFTPEPDWYIGPSGMPLTTALWASQLGRTSGAMGTAMSSLPRTEGGSSSGAGSSFGGGGSGFSGGFSGGGGGGGGGGAW